MQMLTVSVGNVAEQISERRKAFPRSIALSGGGQQLTYEELDFKADRVAAYLSWLNILPGDIVAICMERSFDWIVAALGIMRAGAAYVPLDPAWPDSRLRYALEDSGAAALVGRTPLLDRLQMGARGIDPRRDAKGIAGATAVAKVPIQPESLAYLIYTSGSTGVPKGVEITHANLCHLVRWHLSAFEVDREDRASHLAGLGFDAAVWEIWPHLCAGATLCLAPDSIRSSPDAIQKWMIDERVTIGFVPTVHATPMMSMSWPSTTALRFLLTGGDALTSAPAMQLPFAVVNNYGPTECTVVATSIVLAPSTLAPSTLTPGSGKPPIGRAILGASVYILGENGEPIPDGSVGEIYVGGSGVGRGYRNLPDATDRSFLPDPFTDTPAGRMYRTGDRGVRNPDGEIEFRGRLDRQTKIRGQRVELDEIGALLENHPGVDFATVVTRVSEKGENQLAAYILPSENAPVPTTDELQEHLRRSLPDYMVPAIFARLQSIPLSSSGKVDLSLLPEPTVDLLKRAPATGSAAKASILAPAAPIPSTPIQEQLLAMVRDLLDNDTITARDNFFLAGGHSLLGMQLLMRFRTAFGVELTLQQLFEAPTVESIAVLIGSALDETKLHETRLGEARLAEAGLDQSRETETAAKDESKEEPRFPAGVLARQNDGASESIYWIHYLSANLALAIDDKLSFLSIALTAEDLQSLGEAPTLQSIAACLLGKILKMQPMGPYNIGGHCVGGILAFEMAAQLRAAGHAVSFLVLVDTPNPSHSRLHNFLTPRVSSPRYLLKRMATLGLRTSLMKLRKRSIGPFSALMGDKVAGIDVRIGQEAIEDAAHDYKPEEYDGKVLLLLATDRPPHVDILPGWEPVVPGNLHAQYLNGHHSDLMKAPIVHDIADIIVEQLTLTTV